MRNLIKEMMLEENRFGAISVLLIITSILGGIAAGMFLGSIWALAVIAAVTMITESMILAVQPMKRIVKVSLLASAVNSLFILGGLIF